MASEDGRIVRRLAAVIALSAAMIIVPVTACQPASPAVPQVPATFSPSPAACPSGQGKGSAGNGGCLPLIFLPSASSSAGGSR